MPHFIVECTENIRQEARLPELFASVNTALANAVFSLGEHAEMDAVHPDQQLEMFWRIWTRKEAIVKQRGGSAWQIVSVDSTYHSSLSVSHCQLDNLSLAICTPTPFTLSADSVQWIDSAN